MAFSFSSPARLIARIRSFSYPGAHPQLKDFNFEVSAGECLIILGASGAGKTTLLKILDGLYKDYHGEIYLDGKEIRHLKPKEIYSKMGLLFQNPDEQLFAPTVYEDVAFGPRNMGLPEKEVRERVTLALKMVELEGYEGESISHLSFGQKKRVALAGLLAMGQRILLLDEPTLGLDPVREKNFLLFLKKLKEEEGLTLIIATHQVDIVPVLADRVLVIHQGRMHFLGPVEVLFGVPRDLQEVYLRLPLVSEVFLPLWGKKILTQLPLSVEEGQGLIKRLILDKTSQEF